MLYKEFMRARLKVTDFGRVRFLRFYPCAAGRPIRYGLKRKVEQNMDNMTMSGLDFKIKEMAGRTRALREIEGLAPA